MDLEPPLAEGTKMRSHPVVTPPTGRPPMRRISTSICFQDQPHLAIHLRILNMSADTPVENSHPEINLPPLHHSLSLNFTETPFFISLELHRTTLREW